MKNQFLTIEEVLKNANSIANQDIKGQFIGREVFCNVNQMVEYILRKGWEDSDAPFNMDDVENMYSYPEYIGEHANFEGGTEEERDAEIERLEGLKDSILDASSEDYETDSEAIAKINEEIEELQNLENEPQEVYEWWAVSGWLYGKLKDLGHPVLGAGSCYVWGRCTTGQAILLDYSISQICADMEILEGQKNSWAKK